MLDSLQQIPTNFDSAFPLIAISLSFLIPLDYLDISPLAIDHDCHFSFAIVLSLTFK